MRVFPFILVVLLLLVVGLWVVIARERPLPDIRPIPDERLPRLLEQSQRNEQRLVTVAAQNVALTTRTLAIIERLAPAVSPALIAGPSPVASSAPVITLVHEPDRPLVLYEGVPVRPAAKGRRP
jgi:hypothetical protein